MRNEGPFVLEWVAYHRMIGFDDVYVVTNECTDGTDLILDRLMENGLVHHIRQKLAPGEGAQSAGMAKVLARPEMEDTAWLLHCDADEFLRVTHGRGQVKNLIRRAGGDADVIALLWRPYGNMGQHYWRGGSVLRAFPNCQHIPRPQSAGHKSMFRPALFAAAIDHMPKEPRSPEVRVVNTLGENVAPAALFKSDQARYRMPLERLTWEVACINHYAVKSNDIFLMKNDRGDGMNRKHVKYRIHSRFYLKHNRTDMFDPTMVHLAGKVEAMMSDWLQDSKLRALDAASLADFWRRRDWFLTPEVIAELTEPAPVRRKQRTIEG